MLKPQQAEREADGQSSRRREPRLNDSGAMMQFWGSPEEARCGLSVSSALLGEKRIVDPQ
jgi:hypothetical protein